MFDLKVLEVATQPTIWNWLVPSTVNVFLSFNLNNIPTRFNLDKRGIDVGSVSCLICDLDVETVNHVFFCEMTTDLWGLLSRWWELDLHVFSSVA